MKFENIVIAPCGNRSKMFNDFWLQQKQEKEFDLCLLFYHDNINEPDKYSVADFFFHLKDFKYFMIYKLLTELKPEWLHQYKYFYFLDDDIKIDTKGINAMFALSKAFQSDISQASLSKNSFCSWPMFKQQKKSFCRFVGQVEVMAPLFSAEALQKCMPSFIGNKSSWGVDSVWSKILNYPKNKLIVFDAVIMEHTMPVGGGELYEKIGVDPHEDWRNIVTKYDAHMQNYREYGRLSIVNENSNRLNFAVHKKNEIILRIKRMWNDYDLASRVRSQIKKVLRKP